MGRWSEYDDDLAEPPVSLPHLTWNDGPMSAKQFERYRNDPVAFAKEVLGVENASWLAAEMRRLRAELDDDELLSRVSRSVTTTKSGADVQAKFTTYGPSVSIERFDRFYADRGKCVRDDKGNFHVLHCVSSACTGCGPEHLKRIK